jgi:hypothetical protein
VLLLLGRASVGILPRGLRWCQLCAPWCFGVIVRVAGLRDSARSVETPASRSVGLRHQLARRHPGLRVVVGFIVALGFTWWAYWGDVGSQCSARGLHPGGCIAGYRAHGRIGAVLGALCIGALLTSGPGTLGAVLPWSYGLSASGALWPSG